MELGTAGLHAEFVRGDTPGETFVGYARQSKHAISYARGNIKFDS